MISRVDFVPGTYFTSINASNGIKVEEVQLTEIPSGTKLGYYFELKKDARYHGVKRYQQFHSARSVLLIPEFERIRIIKEDVRTPDENKTMKDYWFSQHEVVECDWYIQFLEKHGYYDN